MSTADFPGVRWREEVADGQVHVDSPVPVRFVSRSGEKSSAAAGHSEFTL